MERILFVVFSDAAGARAGLRALTSLDRDGSIALYAATIVVKRPDGAHEELERPNKIAPLVSAGLRRFVRAVEGARVTDAALEAEWIDVDGEFVGDAYAAFETGSAALVADVDEERVTPVDARMEALNGFVLRRARSGVPAALLPERLSLLDAEIARLDIERVNAHALRRRKLEEATAAMLTRRDRLVAGAAKRRDAAREEAMEKVKLLLRKAATGGGAGTRHRERIALLARAHGLPSE